MRNVSLLMLCGLICGLLGGCRETEPATTEDDAPDAGAPSIDDPAPSDGAEDPVEMTHDDDPANEEEQTNSAYYERYSPTEGDSPDVLALHSTIEAWRDRTLDQKDLLSIDTDRCANYMATLEIAAPHSEEFRRLCGVCDQKDPDETCETVGRAYACSTYGVVRDENGDSHGAQAHSIVVIDQMLGADPYIRGQLVLHEVNHQLGYCAEEGLDAGHGAASRWCGSDRTGCTDEEVFTSVGTRAQDYLADWTVE